ncbi:MAG: AraC family transcriptional regulator [Suipraeoptans sp.]
MLNNVKKLSGFCGYESDIHFIRQLKKTQGITPTEFRNLSAR